MFVQHENLIGFVLSVLWHVLVNSVNSNVVDGALQEHAEYVSTVLILLFSEVVFWLFKDGYHLQISDKTPEKMSLVVVKPYKMVCQLQGCACNCRCSSSGECITVTGISWSGWRHGLLEME